LKLQLAKLPDEYACRQYTAKRPENWRNVSVSPLKIDLSEFAQKLIPVLKSDLVSQYSSPENYAKELLVQCRIFVEITNHGIFPTDRNPNYP
jgi:hypothetical protein